MRILFALPLLLAAACSADHDEERDQVTVQYNEQQAEETASEVGAAAEQAGEAVANGAEAAAAEIRNTDVDVDVNREGGEANADAQ